MTFNGARSGGRFAFRHFTSLNLSWFYQDIHAFEGMLTRRLFYAKPIRNKQTNTLKTQIDARTHAGSHAGTSTQAPDNLSVPQAKRFWARNSSGKLDRQEVLCGGDHLSILDLHLASLCALRHQRGSLSAAVPTCTVSFP